MCFELEEVLIPQSVTKIGHCAFLNCEKLERLTLSENIKKIEHKAFDGCDNLIVTCPINSYAYRYCKKNHIQVEITGL